jgi:catechol 2,3-dioxygenase-like lactoylglutathione lyase family enzyme
MLKGIDHIVVAVPDLETAITNYSDLGFTVVRGGEHPSIGSHNALIAFQDGAYIELIAFRKPDVEHRWIQLLKKGGGLVDYCMQTDDLKSDMATFRAAGATLTDIMPLSRTRPDGYKLDWVLSAAVGPHQGMAPFLIEDITPREERVPAQIEHNNGVTGIGTMTLAVRETDPVRQWYKALLNSEGETVEREDLKATGLRFRIGPHTFDYLVPQGNASPLRKLLDEREATVYSASLKTTGDARVLDLQKTLNARFSLVS